MKTRRKSVNKKTGKKGMNWQIITLIATILIAVIGFVLQRLYYQSERKRYLEQQNPEIECYYEYFAQEDKCEFYIKNVGLVDCKNIWVEEKIFVIVDDEVYEGEDVPHFNYLVFDGSRTKMWDLPRGFVRSIGLERLQRIAFRRLVEKFEPIIISKWLISFSSKASVKTYHFEKYFIHMEDRIPQVLQSSVGGESILNKIKNYLVSGPKQAIRIFDFTQDFELNTPTNYLINKDYSITPLYPWTTLSIEEINNSIFFYATGEPQPADDTEGSIRHFWNHKDGKWQKWTKGEGKFKFYTKAIRMLIDYLSKEDAERVRKNPKLINFLDPDKQPSSKERKKEKIIEITEKIRAKFLNTYKK